jgi:hypothetical protein
MVQRGLGEPAGQIGITSIMMLGLVDVGWPSQHLVQAAQLKSSPFIVEGLLWCV